MTSSRPIVRPALVACLTWWLAGHTPFAQETPSPSREYQPSVGQLGKDVIWVPTPEALVERMLEMADVGPEDYVIDLGSGDGRTVIRAAEEFGARGLGIEYNSDLVALSKRNAARAGVADQVEFVEADLFESDFSRATVVAMYLLPSLNLKLRPKILELSPGTRVVSNSFDMADWRPDQTITVEDHTAYLWIVPAQVAGRWKLTLPAEGLERTLELEQEFQMLSGRIHLPDGWFDVVDGRIRGSELRFRIIDASGNRREITGRILGNRMEGTLETQDGRALPWYAVAASSRKDRT